MAGVTLVDYGLGNIRAFANIFRTLNMDVTIASTRDELAQADKLILPGVGAFDWAMSRLNASGLRDTLDDLVLAKQVPVLGVCVGMQMMADRSEEGKLPGLGWIGGSVVHFPAEAKGMPLPHMGWNDVTPRMADCLFRQIDAPRYYFLHSFCFSPSNADNVLAVADYGHQFVSAVRKGNIFGTQFHPEKSHQWGISLLRNYAELAPC